ncbi:inositol monophosphatase [Pontiella sp.]|uniref:inositol monophosphatase family protein n=1 Tax=Pontiella sp. TaxID=2837462 RepID=UPI00356A0835
MSEPSLDHLLDVAICAAEAAGKHAFNNKERRTETTETFNHDVKLLLDVESQKAAEAIIESEFPDHGILGEEEARPNRTSAYEWIIDPIDGTMNFSHGFEYWCSSVAVRRNNQVVAGCIFAPDFDAYYTAHSECEAKRNGTPIRVRETNRLSEAMVFSGLSKEMENQPDTHFSLFRMLALNTKKLRINGAAALDLCRVADGTADAFFEGGIFLWDYAAGVLIAERAGAVSAVYPDISNPHGATVLVSNQPLMDGLKAIYTKCI